MNAKCGTFPLPRFRQRFFPDLNTCLIVISTPFPQISSTKRPLPSFCLRLSYIPLHFTTSHLHQTQISLQNNFSIKFPSQCLPSLPPHHHHHRHSTHHPLPPCRPLGRRRGRRLQHGHLARNKRGHLRAHNRRDGAPIHNRQLHRRASLRRRRRHGTRARPSLRLRTTHYDDIRARRSVQRALRSLLPQTPNREAESRPWPRATE
ncbi:hypothetical protein K491DRAFT_504566 [Lophiostoma macrostomum CBS 122681]|uniref:Uncharacterized protein n=1 Tax=Lophiostoma macrostomum CBS 122681 TaxID=1314788 RepID=A0A6A6TP58_9PLEO|nr:hypothetical protein K491DRAFT_504566 [Lophiostoma macrostomum CBS 122681]